MAEKILIDAAKITYSGGITEIEVLTETVRREIGLYRRVTHAALILTVAGGVNPDGFAVQALSGGEWETIDYITPPAIGAEAEVVITQEIDDVLKNDQEKVVLRVAGGLSFLQGSRLKAEYIPQRIMYAGNEYYEVSAGRAGGGKVNLATGALNFVHEDSAASKVCHVYNSWQANGTGVEYDCSDLPAEEREAAEKYCDYGCGKGWKLNVHQRLMGRSSGAGGELYTYVDGDGNYHEFGEKYYCERGDVKVYLDKDAVTVGLDGSLTHDGAKVETELQSTSGLTLLTDYAGFAGAEKLQLSSEERAGLEEDIENLGRTIADCRFALTEYEKTQDAGYKALEALRAQIEEQAAQTERVALSANATIKELTESVLASKRELDLFLKKDQTTGEYLTEQGRDFEVKQAEYETKLAEYQAAVKAVAEATAETGADSSGSGPTKAQLRLQNAASDNLNAAQAALSAAQKALNQKAELLQQVIREKTGKIENANTEIAGTMDQRKEALLDLQDKYREDTRAYDSAEGERHAARNRELCGRTRADLQKAERLLEYKEFELKRLEDAEPVRFIKGDGIVMGFNRAGALTVTADAYENVTRIDYDESGRIIGITEESGAQTALVYEDGLLVKIIDAEEKVTSFEYHGNNYLACITYPDGTSSDFGYVRESGLLSRAVNPSGYGLKFSYENGKAAKVEETARAYSISEDGWRGFSGEAEEREYAPRLLAEITYNDYLSTTLSDRGGNLKTYVFDIMGKPATVYEGGYGLRGDSARSMSIDYIGTRQTFRISDNLSCDNLLKSMGGAQLSGTLTANPKKESMKIYDIDLSGLPESAANLVFSAWVKADSAAIESGRKTGYSRVESSSAGVADVFKKNRRFELRAELDYLNETGGRESEEFSASFDWLNTQWQYLALPVAIRRADRVGDRIVGRFPFKLGSGDRTPVGLRVIIDYSYNVGGRYDGLTFDCAALREGEWTYNKINLDGTVNYTEQSAGGVTFYEYDKNGRVIKATAKDKSGSYETAYEYDKRGALIRSTDSDGLCEEIVFDDKGRRLRTITYNVADPTSKLYSESLRDDNGRVIADVDTGGEFNAANYGYDNLGRVNVITDALGNKTAFGYRNGDLVSVSRTADGEENKNTVKRTLGYVTKLSSGGTDYSFTYDGWGRQTEIRIAGENYSSIRFIEDAKTKAALGRKSVWLTATFLPPSGTQ